MLFGSDESCQAELDPEEQLGGSYRRKKSKNRDLPPPNHEHSTCNPPVGSDVGPVSIIGPHRSQGTRAV